MHYVIFTILVAALAYATHTWVDARALAMVVGDKWVIAGQGWSGLWPILLAGLLPGLVLGLFGGSGFGKLIENWIDDGMDATRQKLAEDRAQLEAQKSALDTQIRNAAAAARQQTADTVKNVEIAMMEAQNQATAQKIRVKHAEGRLKGAQQRAKRKEKALLMSRNTAKPTAV